MNRNLIINNRYVIDKRIGKGSFGDVYLGFDQQDQNPVAIKVEKDEGQKTVVLSHEYAVYQTIHENSFLIPKVYWFGKVDQYYIMIMQNLGQSLDHLFDRCNKKFSLKTVLMIGIQIFDIIRSLHENHYIHRDLKPDNFLMGRDNMSRYVYLIDFGLSKRYKNDDRMHIGAQTGKKIVGTARYSSINSHLGVELSRRDDLESLGYIMLYFLKGRLPWQDAQGITRDEKYTNICRIKQEHSIQHLCHELPDEFMYFLTHVRSLEFKERPNYVYLRSLLTNLMEKSGYKFDYRYDWI